MPSCDVLVAGAGLAGLTTALAAADGGASVWLVAKGHAATHWSHGGLDLAAPPGTVGGGEGVALLARRPGHPYEIVAEDLPAGLARVRRALDAAGLAYEGDLASPHGRIPTAVGATRPAGVLPGAQAAARAPWRPGEGLLVVGFERFRDFAAPAVAASLARPLPWAGAPRPERVTAVGVTLPGLAERRNLDGLDLARAFDDPSWRGPALDAIARAVEPHRGDGELRVAFPAVLGLADHPAVAAALDARLGGPWFEIPLVPPSVPGLRLYEAMVAALRAARVAVQVGFAVSAAIRTPDGRVAGLATAAAGRPFPIRAGQVVLATGGFASGGLVATADGRVEEPILGLPVEAPPQPAWLAPSMFDPAGHPLEAAGIRTDRKLRPVGPTGERAERGVRIAGALLAGARALRERSGDGIAIASGERAARLALARTVGALAVPSGPVAAGPAAGPEGRGAR